MDLREELHFDAASIKSIAITSADDPGVVVELFTLMPPEIVKTMKLDFLMNGSIVREEITSLPVNVYLQDIELTLPSGLHEDTDSYFVEPIHKINVKRTDEAQLGGTFRFHLPLNDADSIIDFFRKYNKQEFSMRLRPRQGELFEGGRRVDMSPDAEKEEAQEAQEEVPDRSHENKPRGRRAKKTAVAEEAALPVEEEPLLQ